jgi:hypothetical protein
MQNGPPPPAFRLHLHQEKRAAVLGANDGIVSTASFIVGLAVIWIIPA